MSVPRKILVSVIFVSVCLQGKLLRSLMGASLSSTGIDGIADNYGAIGDKIYIQHTRILDKTVKLLFMGDATATHKYLKDHPSSELKIYIHQLPQGVRSVESISKCLETWGHNHERYIYPTKEVFLDNLCDWSETICNPKNHTDKSQYSTARLNNNYDAVVARLFINYLGILRTHNISEAIFKVVPFPANSNTRCNMYNKRSGDNSVNILLDHYNTTPNLHDHLFLSLRNDHAPLFLDRLPSQSRGHLVVPYANTNAEYQAGKSISSMNTYQLDRFFSAKKVALAAVFSKKISGNGYARVKFAEKAEQYFGNGTLLHGNGTLGGMPVDITVIQEKRKMVGEARTMQLYRDSIFCPIFRGDTPDQKRFFDVILSGCIPVVMAHYWKEENDEHNRSSYFAPGVSLSTVYPWARGSFGEKYSGMGIDYSQLVIEIDEKDCGMDCLPTALLSWLNDPVALREKQKLLATYSCLFSYSMNNTAFNQVDAMSALAVRARHYVMHDAPL